MSTLNQHAAVISSLLFLVFVPQAGATPPTPEGRVILEPKAISGTLPETRTIAIPVEIELDDSVATGELTVVLRRVRSPVSAHETDEEAQRFATAIKPESPQKYAPAMKITDSGDYEIDARLKGETRDGNGFSDRAIAYLVVSPDGQYRALTPKEWTGERRRAREDRFNELLKKDPKHPEIRLLFEDTVAVPPDIQVQPHPVPLSQQLIDRPAGLSEMLRRYTVDKSTTSGAANDPLTVRGRLIYRDWDGIWRPLANVSVGIWDEEWGLDELLDWVVTDWNGDWSYSVDNNDGFLQDGRDIYYTFVLANLHLQVSNCPWYWIDRPYGWKSAVRNNLPDGTVVDYFVQTAASDVGAIQVWNHLLWAWVHSVSNGGQDPGFVASCFPEDETHWDRFWEDIDIEAQYVDGPDVISHEYGHAVMYYAYDEDNPSPGGQHGFDGCSQDVGQAWSEGWGTAFALIGRPDGRFNWHEGQPGRNIENFSASCREGPRSEGRVAAALLDMADQTDDCNGGDENLGRNGVCDSNASAMVPFSTMLRDTLWGSYHEDVMDYWSSLINELSSAQGLAAQDIMTYNWMPAPIPGPVLSSCAASKIVESEADADGVLAGLRELKNIGLKTFPGGRHLINLYNRHSPELASLLLGDRSQLERAKKVLRHFSSLGHDLLGEKSAQPRDDADAMFTDDIAADIDELLQYFDQRGSSELKAALAEARSVFMDVRQLSLADMIEKVSADKGKREANRMTRIHQSDLSDESRKALPELEKAR